MNKRSLVSSVIVKSIKGVLRPKIVRTIELGGRKKVTQFSPQSLKRGKPQNWAFSSLLLSFLPRPPASTVLSFCFLKFLFIFGCSGSSMLHTGFLQSWGAGPTLSSQSTGSEHRLRSWGSGAQLPHGVWALPGPGIEPASPGS